MTVSATEVSVKRELTVWLISSLCSKFHWYGKSFFFKREPTTSGFVAQLKAEKKEKRKTFWAMCAHVSEIRTVHLSYNYCFQHILYNASNY